MFTWFFAPARGDRAIRAQGLLLLLIGAIITIGAIIGYNYNSYLEKKRRDKRVDSMSQSDLAKMFDCPSSGYKGVVHLIKLVKNQILVKQSCPPYRARLLRIPLRLKDQCVSYFRDTVFRCYKCGQEATVDHVKFSGPWTLVKLSCPTHGNNIPYHKIWSTVYSDISNNGIATPQTLDETLSEKISNYFSDRIEEIKEGMFVPSYDQVKDLPEFSGINRDEFIISRNGWFKQTFNMSPNKWYKQNFHMNFNEYSSRLASNLAKGK